MQWTVASGPQKETRKVRNWRKNSAEVWIDYIMQPRQLEDWRLHGELQNKYVFIIFQFRKTKVVNLRNTSTSTNHNF